jgi:hypothetical protein
MRYSADDFKKYTYYTSARWIWCVREILARVDLDTMDADDINHLLGTAQIGLYHAGFANNENECLGDFDADCEPESRDDLNTYDDGRPVTTTVEWDGGQHTQVWHPDPLHPGNFSQVLWLKQQTPAAWRIALIGENGVLDHLVTESWQRSS